MSDDVNPTQVRRIKTVRAYSLSRSSSVASLHTQFDTAAINHKSGPHPHKEAESWRSRVKCALLGVKGSMLPADRFGYRKAGAGRGGEKPENPVARLKLLLVGIVFVLVG
jgi:hypothetical protein